MTQFQKLVNVNLTMRRNLSLHKAREGLMTAIDFFEQHPSLSPSHLEQLWSTLRALDTTSIISRKQTCVTDFFQI